MILALVSIITWQIVLAAAGRLDARTVLARGAFLTLITMREVVSLNRSTDLTRSTLVPRRNVFLALGLSLSLSPSLIYTGGRETFSLVPLITGANARPENGTATKLRGSEVGA